MSSDYQQELQEFGEGLAGAQAIQQAKQAAATVKEIREQGIHSALEGLAVPAGLKLANFSRKTQGFKNFKEYARNRIKGRSKNAEDEPEDADADADADPNEPIDMDEIGEIEQPSAQDQMLEADPEDLDGLDRTNPEVNEEELGEEAGEEVGEEAGEEIAGETAGEIGGEAAGIATAEAAGAALDATGVLAPIGVAIGLAGAGVALGETIKGLFTHSSAPPPPQVAQAVYNPPSVSSLA